MVASGVQPAGPPVSPQGAAGSQVQAPVGQAQVGFSCWCGWSPAPGSPRSWLICVCPFSCCCWWGGFPWSSPSVVSAPGARSGLSYSAAVRGGQGSVGSARARAGNLPTSAARRNVVQLKWSGEGPPLSRREVIDQILEMGFRVMDIFAFIAPVGTGEYDVSFMRPELLDLF
ncbi:unnamed protein product [Staurois parvus]|uniref:Zinc finger CCHC domain-containing protein n=1 Tax=Staurois parvus TaxID=386267 RepID=A0ABN9H4N1_9NEOB|nr:unnamed protein product [Staurois parvus]